MEFTLKIVLLPCSTTPHDPRAVTLTFTECFPPSCSALYPYGRCEICIINVIRFLTHENLSLRGIVGAGRWLSREEGSRLLQNRSVPSAYTGQSTMACKYSSRNLMPFSGLHRHLCPDAHTQTQKLNLKEVGNLPLKVAKL